MLSCGIIIQNEEGEILACLPWGKKSKETKGISNIYDIPKGEKDPNDLSDLDAALRELYEETGIRLTDEEKMQLKDCGVFRNYRTEKDLHLYLLKKSDVNLNGLMCESKFINKWGSLVPEMIGYRWVKKEEISQKMYTSLGPVLLKCLG